ncbi:hypothetical protein Barba29S_gp057 [Rheinheimera phage vB_RspM_Barba29S]|nr:hypothetical protein Barba29S_gp057 [Rheinheimera phage vB_RspM_Barba29S]
MRKSVKMLNLDGGLFQVVCIENNNIEITKVVGFGEAERYSTQDAMFIEFFKHTQKCIEDKQKEIYGLQNKIGKMGG